MKKLVGIFLSLLITLSAIAVPFIGVGYAEESVDISAVKETYKIETGIVGYPTVTTFVDGQSQLDKLSTDEKTPAMAFLRVKANGETLNVVDKNGVTIAELYDCLANGLGNRIIPAFYVQAEDSETAQKVCAFIKKWGLVDCAVVSSDGELLQSVYFETVDGVTRTRGVSCILEVTDGRGKSLLDLSNMAASVGARAVLMDMDEMSSEEFLQYRETYAASALTVYFQADDKAEVFQAIERGADAVCITDYGSAISVYESFQSTTVIRPITLQAHRGTDALFHENTLEGIATAATTGTNTIEIDPRLSKDKQIVLSHDPTVDRVANASGYVSDYTLAELKAMTINVNSSALPSKFCALEEVFILYERYGYSTPLALDAKETDPDYIQILYDLIDEYDAWKWIASVGVADSSQLSVYREVFDGKVCFDVVKSITPQDLIDDYGNPVEVYGGDLKKAVAGWLKSVNSAAIPAGSVAPYYTGIVKAANRNAMPKIVREMNDRGIKVSPYQFDNESEMIEAFYLNLRNLSTGNAVYFSTFLNRFDVKDVAVKQGDAFSITGDATALNGEKSVGWANGFVLVDGDESVLAYENGSFVAKNDGQAKVMLYTSFNNGKVSYVRYSNVVTVVVGNHRTDNAVLRTDANASNGAEWTVWFIVGGVGLALCAGGVATGIILKRRKKTNG